MTRTILLAAALSLAAFGANAQTAGAGSGASGAASVDLQGGAYVPPDSPLANLQNGQVTTDTPRPAVGAQANAEAYPSDGSASDPNSPLNHRNQDSSQKDSPSP